MTEILDRPAGSPGPEPAAADPAAVAYLDPDLGTVPYGQLRDAVDRHAARLRALGLAPGRAAVVVADDSVATVVTVLALWRAGAVPAVISPLLTDDEIGFVLGDCDAALVHLDGPDDRAAGLAALAAYRPVTTGAELRHDLATGAGPSGEPGRPAGPATDPAATVLLQYTSGSTGRPKAVRHTARGLAAVGRGFGALLGLTPTDRVFSTAKMSFGYGFGNSLLFPLAAGATAVLHRGPVDALVLGQVLRRHRPTVLMAVPRLYGGLLALARADRAPDLSGVRLAVSAGEHLPAAMSEEFRERYGLPVLNGLGATEVLHIVAATPPGVAAPGSTGRAVPGVTLTARAADGTVLPDGETGRLHVAGECVAAGYLNRPDEQARTFAEAGAYTGDLVRIVDGEVDYLCRADDVLTVGGQRVPPQDVERLLRAVPGVADCAVVAGVGALGLQEVHAYLVPDQDAAADPDGLVERVTEDMRTRPPQLRPGRLTVVPALPTTSTGKLARFQLRAASPVAGPRVRRTLLRPGAGRKLVALPYAGGTADAYAELAERLPADWAVVSGDVTGHRDGGVDPLAEAWWATVAADLVPGSVLYGHSLGALVALTLAAWRPVELTGVTVVLSGPPLSGAAGTAGELAGAELLAWTRAHGALPDSDLSDEELTRLVLPRLRRDLEGVHGSWPRLRPPGPVHLVTGSADPLCRAEDLRAFSAAWPAARVHVIDGADHRLPTHAAAALAAVLADLAGTD